MGGVVIITYMFQIMCSKRVKQFHERELLEMNKRHLLYSEDKL